MPEYLFEVSYTLDGVRGVREQGGTARLAAAREAAASVGGTVKTFHYAFGGTDVYAIGEFPDNTSAAAFALAVGASGAVDIRTVVLLSPEEIDAAVRREVRYRPPGA